MRLALGLLLVSSLGAAASIVELAANATALWLFADNVEDRLGRQRFLALYLLSNVVGAAAASLAAGWTPLPLLLSNGAAAGILGAYFVLYPRSRVLTLFPLPFDLFEVPAVFFLGLWFVVQFLDGLGSLAAAGSDMVGGVAFWAHVMGFVAGAVLVRAMRLRERERVEWWMPDSPE